MLTPLFSFFLYKRRIKLIFTLNILVLMTNLLPKELEMFINVFVSVKNHSQKHLNFKYISLLTSIKTQVDITMALIFYSNFFFFFLPLATSVGCHTQLPRMQHIQLKYMLRKHKCWRFVMQNLVWVWLLGRKHVFFFNVGELIA